MTTAPGSPSDADANPDTAVVEVEGGDAPLAAAIARHPGMSVRFSADASSDLARALGITGERGRVRSPVTLDVLRLGTDERAVNMVVLGPAPDRLGRGHRRHRCRVEVDGRLVHEGRATTVVVANGEYLRGRDVVPRGHPGDGRLEVHVYAVAAGQRRRMRSRLATGTHVPHPGIRTAQGAHVVLHWDRPVRLEVDGTRRPRVRDLEVTLGAGEVTLVP